jgi:hypothetical protein
MGEQGDQVGRGGLAGGDAGEHGERLSDAFGEERLLTGVVFVEGGTADIGGSGDVRDADGAVAAGEQQGCEGVADRAPGALCAAVGRGGWTSGCGCPLADIPPRFSGDRPARWIQAGAVHFGKEA